MNFFSSSFLPAHEESASSVKKTTTQTALVEGVGAGGGGRWVGGEGKGDPLLPRSLGTSSSTGIASGIQPPAPPQPYTSPQGGGNSAPATVEGLYVSSTPAGDQEHGPPLVPPVLSPSCAGCHGDKGTACAGALLCGRHV